MRLRPLSLVLARFAPLITALLVTGLASASRAQNVALNKPVTIVTGSANGTLFSITDGAFLPSGNHWQSSTVWWNGNTTLEINLLGTHTLMSAIVQADDNDSYTLLYHRISDDSWQPIWTVPFSSGGGMRTRPDVANDTTRFNFPSAIVTDRLRFLAVAGDNSFSVSEVQVFEQLQPVWRSSYMPALGTLPQAQGWTYFVSGNQPSPTVFNGLLLQGPATQQFWRRSGSGTVPDIRSQGFATEIDLRVVSSTYSSSSGGSWYAGYMLSASDATGRGFTLGFAGNGVRIAYLSNVFDFANYYFAGGPFSSIQSSDFIPFDTTTASNTYLVTADSAAVRLFINGVFRASIPLSVGGMPTESITFGTSPGFSSQTVLRSVRVGVLGISTDGAGPSDNAVVSGTRSDPGPGSSTTLTYQNLDVLGGGFFSLGSGETLNLNNGLGTLNINIGGVFIGNGVIIGSVINNGLFIIPITRAGIINNTRGGVNPIIPPTPPMPGDPPISIPFPPGPPVHVNPGTFVPIGGSGFGPVNWPGGGAPGGGGPGGGNHYIIDPPIMSDGTVAWDGELEVTGSFTQSATGILRMFIAGDVQGETYSYLNVHQTIALDGALQVVLQPELFGYLPNVGDSFDILHADDGITLSPTLDVRTYITAAGAAQLNWHLPAYNSGFAADPNQLVSLHDQNYFSTALVDGGHTLRVTLQRRLCRADYTGDNVISVQDFFDFIAAFFGNDPRGDFNASGTISPQDIFDFLAAYFQGCP